MSLRDASVMAVVLCASKRRALWKSSLVFKRLLNCSTSLWTNNENLRKAQVFKNYNSNKLRVCILPSPSFLIYIHLQIDTYSMQLCNSFYNILQKKIGSVFRLLLPLAFSYLCNKTKWQQQQKTPSPYLYFPTYKLMLVIYIYPSHKCEGYIYLPIS